MLPSFTVFTVSHSITLTLPTLGYVHVPQQPVERVSALSIVFVAGKFCADGPATLIESHL